MKSELRAQIESLIKNNSVMLFMKGTRERPQCGFSKQVVAALNHFTNDYATFDVLSDPELREGIKVYSQWPTIPQLYVNGEFIGGCDIVLDLLEKDELPNVLGLVKASHTPTLEITPSALQAFKNACNEQSEEAIRISIAADFEHGLSFDHARSQDFMLHIDGLTFVIDPYSAARAQGLKIDFITDKLDSGFSFDNPNEPPLVQEMSVEELDKAHKEHKKILLIDVRPQKERELAYISFATPLEQMSEQDINNLDTSTLIVFHCHHGRRSRHQAEKWRQKGFKNLYNLTGGIDAWARKIDTSVPVYTN